MRQDLRLLGVTLVLLTSCGTGKKLTDANARIADLTRKTAAYEKEIADLKRAVELAIPTPVHYLPMLYAVALRRDGDGLRFFTNKALGGSLTMTSFRIG